MRVLISLIALLSFTGCMALGARPGDLKELSDKRTTVKGRLAANPELVNGNKRIRIYLIVGSGEEMKTILAIAENEENRGVLEKVSTFLLQTPEDKPIFLYGKEVTGRWNEYLKGVDFEVYAVGVYVKSGDKYLYVITGYGNAWYDDISWTKFLKVIVKEGAKVAK